MHNHEVSLLWYIILQYGEYMYFVCSRWKCVGRNYSCTSVDERDHIEVDG
jgi:hypothetical protein